MLNSLLYYEIINETSVSLKKNIDCEIKNINKKRFGIFFEISKYLINAVANGKG